LKGPNLNLENTLTTFIQMVPVGITQCDVSGNFIDINEEFSQMIGYESEKIKTMSIWDITPPGHETTEKEVFASLLHKDAFGPCQKEYVHRKGHRINVMIKGVLIPNKRGENEVWMVVQDVTDQLERKKALESAEQRNRLALQAADAGIWQLSLIDYTLNWDDKTFQVMGVNKEDFNNHFEDWRKTLIAEDLPAIEKSLYKAIHELDRFDSEMRIVHPNSDVKFIKTHAVFGYNKEGEKISMTGVVWDITKSKQIEKEKEAFTKILEQKVLERTEELENARIELEKSLEKEKELGELKSRFVSTASHQFRTPLTVINTNVGLLEILKEKTNSENRIMINKITNRIKSEIVRMTNVMDEVLTISKINSGGIIPTFKKVNVWETCASIAQNYNDVQEDGRVCKVSVEGDNFSLSLDANLFEQAFSNILSNAFKYSMEKPAPEITITDHSYSVVIVITDFGMGIPEEEMKNLFIPFYRASNALDISGTGLGTSIMKEYIELNNGSLTIESTINKGTSVTITFKRQ
jgi:PAS domain S-box-containing protein